MIDLTYTSDNGISFPLVAERMYLKSASFHEYEWEPESTNYKYGDLLKTFTKKAKSYSCTLAFSGPQSQRERTLESLHDAWERDIFVKRAGKLTWNGYEIDCFIIASKTYPNDSNTRTLNDVTIYCPYPFWIKKTKFEFDFTDHDVMAGGLDFPFDLPCDLGYRGLSRRVLFDATIPLDFEMVIRGEVHNPKVVINDHVYEVFIDVPQDGTLTISSYERNNREKSVILTDADGNQTSALNYRNRNSYIFEQIITDDGQINVGVEKEFDFDLYIIEQRSEPKWI